MDHLCQVTVNVPVARAVEQMEWRVAALRRTACLPHRDLGDGDGGAETDLVHPARGLHVQQGRAA